MDPVCNYPIGTTNTKRKTIGKSTSVSRATATTLIKKVGENQLISNNEQTEPYCHVKLDSIIKLKDSTKKLLSLLENIQSKTRAINIYNDLTSEPILEKAAAKKESSEVVNSVTDVCSTALKRLETQTEILQKIPVEDEDDDCSIFKRLTRKCICLNQQEYNDLMIQFNENTKYYTSTTGEIIKNLRIIKKFLFMGGGYSKQALTFLNEGLEFCSLTEKLEITQGCAHADMCNVFEDISIVVSCIAWPIKHDTYGDSVTQELAASFLFKLSQYEEGRRYLNFTSKIITDIKKVLTKKMARLSQTTVQTLQATMDALHPKLTENYKNDNRLTDHEGYGIKTIKDLDLFRKYMTLGEIYAHLDLLYTFSFEEKGKIELTICLRPLVVLFRDMLKVYDDSRMNIIITNILNNIISQKILREAKNNSTSKTATVTHNVGTEPILMKTQCCQQIPLAKKAKSVYKKTNNRSKSHVKMISYNDTSNRSVSFNKVSSIHKNMKHWQNLKEKKNGNNVIIVPRE